MGRMRGFPHSVPPVTAFIAILVIAIVAWGLYMRANRRT
jgi:hypothetical protein